MWEGPMGGAELTPTPLSRGSGDSLPAPGAAALKCAEASLQTSSLTLEVVQTSSLTLEVVRRPRSLGRRRDCAGVHPPISPIQAQPGKTGCVKVTASRFGCFVSIAETYCHRAHDNILRSRGRDLVGSLASVIEPHSIISLASCVHACRIA